MTFDFGTLAAAGSLVAFVTGLLLVFAWTQFDYGHAALRLSLSHLLGACAIMLLAFGTVHPILPSLAQLFFVSATLLDERAYCITGHRSILHYIDPSQGLGRKSCDTRQS
jgi:hypothetical protein